MFFKLRKPAEPSRVTRNLDIDGLNIPVILRRNAQARRFILKIGRQKREVLVTMPSNGCETEAMDFAISQSRWIKSRIDAQPGIIEFAPGAEIPLRDVLHTIEHCPGQRGTVWTHGDDAVPIIYVAGDRRHLARRVRDWLKKQARHDLGSSVEAHSRYFSLCPAGISIRDQTTRWGSCSSTGKLSFSWRLILTPGYVLDYVAAHEVAHLEEMNHGPRFWKLVEQRLPDYRQAKKWLKLNGAGLHVYGR